jgi:hypothetical protein
MSLTDLPCEPHVRAEHKPLNHAAATATSVSLVQLACLMEASLTLPLLKAQNWHL